MEVMRGMEIKERKDNFTFSFYAFLGFSAVQLQMRKREKHGERRRREQWSEKKNAYIKKSSHMGLHTGTNIEY